MKKLLPSFGCQKNLSTITSSVKNLDMNNSTLAVNSGKGMFKRLATLSIAVALLFVANVAKSQVIVETFEETAWSTLTSAGAGAVSITYPASTASSQLISSYTQSSASAASVLTSLNALPYSITGAWSYNSVTVTTATNTGASQSNRLKVHSMNAAMQVPTGGGYIVTPVITSGVATVTFWYVGATGNTTIWAGVNTNTTTAGVNSAQYGAPGGPATSSSAGSTWSMSSYTTNNATSGRNSGSFTVSITSAARFGLFPTAGTAVIDDIVITAQPTTYTWNATSGGDYTVSSNWTPARTVVTANDLLQFNDGNTYTVTNVPNETIGTLTVAGTNTRPTLQAATSGNSLTCVTGINVTGTSGNRLIVAGGSNALTLVNAGALTITTSVTDSLEVFGTFVHNSTSSIATPFPRMSIYNGSTFIFRGSAYNNSSNTISGNTFYNLTFESTSGLWTPTLAGSTATTVNGTLNIGGSGAGTVTPSTGYTGTLTANGVTIGSGSTLQPGGPIVCKGVWSNNGTFTHNSQTVTFGTGGIIAGTAITTFSTLTINPTNTTDIVWLDSTSSTPAGPGTVIVNSTLNLSKGIFHVGTGNIVQMNNNTTIDASGGGNFATTGTNGSDGGNIDERNTSGGTLTVKGTGSVGSPTFFNMYSGNTSDANWHLALNNAGTLINGTLSTTTLAGANEANSNQWSLTTNSPVWGPNSTLIMNRAGQGYGNNNTSTLGPEWLAMTSGTIGTTPGYPNNVTLLNLGTSVQNGCGFGPTGTWAINGTLSIGNSTVSCLATLEDMTSLTCGGIVIDNSSTLKHKTETFTVKGNWTQQGTTTGVFSVVSGTTPVIFGGSGTSGSPQTINSTGSSTVITSFPGLTLNNSTYVKLNCPVTLSSTAVLTLTSGILQTDITNLLRLASSANTAIGGNAASSTNMINGPVRQIMATTNTTYTYPVGSGTTPLPLVLASTNTTGTDSVTVQAFAGSFSGTTSLSNVSNTEYWFLSTTSTALPITSTVTVSRPAQGLSTFNTLAASTTSTGNGNGSYSSIGGNITGSGNSATMTSTSVPSATAMNIQLATFTCTPPASTSQTASGATTCTGNGAVVTFNASTLADGTYTVTYNVSGTNTVSSTTANMTFASGTGSFTTSALNTAGASNVVNVTAIALSSTPTCTQSLSVSSAAFTTNTTPVYYTVPGSPILRYDFSSAVASGSGVVTNGGSQTGGGTINGTLTVSTDRFGVSSNAYSGFSASNYLYDPNVYNFNTNLAPYSVSLWFKTTTNGYSGGGVLAAIINAATGENGSHDHNLIIDNGGRLAFGIWTGSATMVATNPAGPFYNDAKWHHVVATIASNNNLKLYVDGTLQSTNTNTTAPSVGTTWFQRIGDNANVWLNVVPGGTYGTALAGPATTSFPGSIDDVTIYSSELTATQVSTLYGTTLAGATTNVNNGAVVTVSSYTLPTGTYTVTYNVSGTNTVASTTASMSFTAGSPGTGTFTTANLTSAGAANVVNITGLSNGSCGSSTFSSFSYSSPAFTTVSPTPIITNPNATSVTSTGATLNATVNDNNSNTNTIQFEYGTSTGYGTTAGATPSTISSGAGNTAVSASISSLTPNTLYHFRADATNGSGTTQGSDATFTTLPGAPTATAATSMFSTNFTANWSAPSPAGTATYTYTVKVATDNGFTNIVSTKSNIASGSLSTGITGLVPGLTYYYEVFAVNATGSSVASNIISVTTNLNNALLSAACTGTSASPGAIVFTYIKPTIDGAIDSVWNKVPVNSSSTTTGAGTPNNTVKWRAMYTADSLYVLATVLDANIVTNNGGWTATVPSFGTHSNTSVNAYDDDGIEIFIDGAGSRAGAYNGKNDFQLRFDAGFGTATNGGNAGFVTGSSGTALFTEVVNQLDYATATMTGGYVVEVALPWRGYTGAAGTAGIDSTGISIANGQSLGFEVANNDNDNTAAGSQGRASILQWASNNTGDFSSTTAFGLATLSGCGTAPTVTTPTATSITSTTATLGATVTGTGSSASAAALLAEGTAIGSTQTNDSTGVVISGNTSVSAFTTSNTGLTPQTKYFYQGYATNNHGETGYTTAGSFFYTLSSPPTALATFTSGTGCVSATLNWNVGTFPGSGATTKGYVLIRAVSPTTPTLSNANGAAPVAGSGTTIVSSTIGSATTTYNDATVSTGTTYNYVLVPFTWDGTNTATYNYLTGGATQSVAITVASAGGTAAGAAAICTGATTTVTLSGNTGTIQWQSSTDNSTFSNVSGGSGATTTSYTTAALNSGLYYRAQVTNGACSAANSNSVLVSVNTSSAGDGSYTSPNWTATPNDNVTGLGAWSLTGVGGGFSGQFTGTSGSSAFDVNSLSFGQYANEHNTASAVRPFSSPMSVGSTINVGMKNGFIVDASDPQSFGSVGVSLQTSGGADLVEFYFHGGDADYSIHDNTGNNQTTIGYTTGGLNIAFAYTGTTGNGTYTLAVTPTGGGNTVYYSGQFVTNGVPAQLRLFNYNSAGHNHAGDANYNQYYNSIYMNGPVVTVQPSASAANYCQNSTPTNLSVTAVGSSLTYAWEQSSTGTGSWSAASGTNTGVSYAPSTATVGTLYYHCIVSGLCSESITSAVSGAITINALPSAPSAGSQSKTYTGVANTTAISATPGGGETIDWYANSTGGGALLSGNTSYTPTSPINVGTYTYYAEARNTITNCVSASRTPVTLTIGQALLTITGNDTTKTYGSTIASPVTGSTRFTSSGLVNGETIGSVTMTYGSGAAGTDPVSGSPYTGQATPSAPTGGTFNAANYSISYASGAIIINPASLTVTARDTSKVYGTTLTSGAGYTNFTSSGLQNGETIGTVTLTYGSGAAGTDPVSGSPYLGQVTPSAATGGTFNASNYSTINYVSGKITVTPAPLTITANNVNKNYGDVLNGSSGSTAFTATGLQNSETIGSVTISYGSGKNAPDAPGTYTGQVFISAAVDGTFDANNYDTTYVNGDIIVSSVIAYWHSVGSSTDWSDPANWTNGIVPDQYKSAVVKTDSVPYPILTQDGTVYGLDLQGDATVGVDQFTLNIYGPVSSGTGTISGSSAAVFDAQVSAGSVVIAGAAGNLKFTDGAQMLYNLTLLDNASATLATPLVIAAGTFSNAGSLNIGNSATLNTGDGLTLKSDDFNTAQVGQVGTSGAINGNVTVERYIRSFFNAPYESDINNVTGPAKRAWRLLTAPISGTQTIFDAWQNGAPSTYIPGIGTFITGQNANQLVNGLDGGLTGLNGSYSMKGFDTTGTGSLVNVANTKVPISGNTGSADNKPYFIFIRGDRDSLTTGNPQFGGLDINNTTLTATGKLQIGTQTFNIQASPDLENGDLQYSMIGNPYMSPVDLNLLTYNNVAPFVYTWDPGLNQVGAYVTLFGGPGQNDFTVSTPSDGSTFQDNFIQSSQAFLVYGGTDAGSSSVVFTEGSKATTNNNKVFRPATGATTFRTNLYLLNADNSFKLADGCLAQYDNAYCSCVDIYDAPKLPNINEQIGLMRGTHLLSIESRPIITTPDTLFLNLQKTTQRNYTYHFYPVSMAQPGMQAFLMDSYLADSTELSLTDSTVVNFSINADVASQATNRFMVVFRPSGVVPVTYTNVKAYQQSADIAVQWSVTNQQNIKEYVVEKSVDGTTWTTVATVTGNTSNTYDWLDANAVSGDNYYRIRSVGTNGAIQYSTVVKVNIGATAPAIAVYPNPIRGGVIGLQMTNMAKGKYGIRLIDNIGRVLMSTEIQHAGGSANQSIHYDNNLAKGVYHIEVNGPNNYKNDIKVMN